MRTAFFEMGFIVTYLWKYVICITIKYCNRIVFLKAFIRCMNVQFPFAVFGGTCLMRTICEDQKQWHCLRK